VFAAADRIHEADKLGFRLTFAAFEAAILGDAPASARVGADFVFQFP
jgi:hypothetical protein